MRKIQPTERIRRMAADEKLLFRRSGHGKPSFGQPGCQGRSRGGLTTKIHAATDAPGMPLRFVLTGGHRHDPAQAMAPAERFRYERLTEDKAYDLSGFAEHITASGPVTPPRSDRLTQREYDHHICEKRHLIECLFNKSKQFRRIFSRSDKLAER